MTVSDERLAKLIHNSRLAAEVVGVGRASEIADEVLSIMLELQSLRIECKNRAESQSVLMHQVHERDDKIDNLHAMLMECRGYVGYEAAMTGWELEGMDGDNRAPAIQEQLDGHRKLLESIDKELEWINGG